MRYHSCGRFAYQVIKPRRGGMPFRPLVRLALGVWSETEGAIHISPTMTEAELEVEIAALHRGLDLVHRRAKAALQRAVKGRNGVKA